MPDALLCSPASPAFQGCQCNTLPSSGAKQAGKMVLLKAANRRPGTGRERPGPVFRSRSPAKGVPGPRTNITLYLGSVLFVHVHYMCTLHMYIICTLYGGLYVYVCIIYVHTYIVYTTTHLKIWTLIVLTNNDGRRICIPHAAYVAISGQL